MGDGKLLGRFDGVVLRLAQHDNWRHCHPELVEGPRALQPRQLCGGCEGDRDVVRSDRSRYQADRHIETREAPQ